MSGAPESGSGLRARTAFEGWLSAHDEFATLVALRGEPLDRRWALARIASLTGTQRDGAYVTVLIERRPAEDTAAFIRSARHPLREWAARLDGLLSGEGGYARWRTRLLFEGKTTSRFDLKLYVVGERSLLRDALAEGHDTAALVTERLVDLAERAFALRLLQDDHP